MRVFPVVGFLLATCWSSALAQQPSTDFQALADFPIVENHRVSGWVRYYTRTRRGRATMRAYLERAGRYLPTIHAELDSRGLPRSLACVAMAESGMDAGARSPKGATGLWQFMRVTARDYELPRDRWVDWRRDPILSSRAAAELLSDLHNSFGDWHLALAAYNAGAGRVRGAMRRSRTRNYWRISWRHLPKETREYVPRVIALMTIAEDPEHYGFENLELAPARRHERILLPGPINLAAVADIADVPPKTMRQLNPSVRGACTPPERLFDLRVPVDTAVDIREVALRDYAVLSEPCKGAKGRRVRVSQSRSHRRGR